ncbi:MULTISPECIES: hypothetical protein [Actinoalloteichus]|uniref:Uncharacterized protein n=1 Tax=Actinoalloteichus fjordicus TaxID=1612552 RepID=A0AAC9LCF0_9PSEU|nr:MULTISPECIES: hypothetical protein [Actinoalloteichus]APU14295.1 hypothetical protein UA74_11175 [Actinoalloteichus fjordicus]APU20264.1 hypothetical protein UA75_11260 [Actinoalloteichus sp. GBA129-24]
MTDHDDANRIWLLTRRHRETNISIIAATLDRAQAEGWLAALGEPYELETTRLLGEEVHPFAWWQVRAIVDGTDVTMGEPQRMRGAAGLLMPGEAEPAPQVFIDEAAGALEQQVHGRAVTVLQAMALDPDTARQLAEEEIRRRTERAADDGEGQHPQAPPPL